MKENMTFFEFFRHRSNGFTEEEASSVEWTDSYFKHFIDVAKNGKHEGDCTKQSFTCDLCLMEQMMEEYRQYIFKYEEWVKDNF